MTPPASTSAASPTAWSFLLLGALAGALGWGIRGQYGHETGAMIAGLLVGLSLVHLLRDRLESLTAMRAVAWTTLAIGIGGSMTYGQTIGLTQNPPVIGNHTALAWGLLGLGLKGAVWVGFAGTFLGMGLGGRQYQTREIALLLITLLAVFALGVLLLNSPFDPANRRLPWIYFSADWRWEPHAALKPRREIWGGLVLALLALLAYVGPRKGDRLAFRLGLWGILGGALGFPLGQSLQAFHAWNPAVFQAGFWVELDPLLNWWNFMETTFGAVLGAALGLGLGLNRTLVSNPPPSRLPDLHPVAETGLVTLHISLLLTTYLVGDFYTEVGLLMVMLPLVAATGGQRAPYLLALPATLLPIAIKTVDRVALQDHAMPVVPAVLLLAVFPLAASIAAAWVAIRRRQSHGPVHPTQPALLLATWLFFGLNFVFGSTPWPWEPWTTRTLNNLVFAACATALTIGALACRPLKRLGIPSKAPA